VDHPVAEGSIKALRIPFARSVEAPSAAHVLVGGRCACTKHVANQEILMALQKGVGSPELAPIGLGGSQMSRSSRGQVDPQIGLPSRS